MPDQEKAKEAKLKGNTAFQAKNYKEAIVHFTEAIKHDPTDHVFYSNRSACYASLEKYEEALADGSECVKLKPDWTKGYTRKGLAEYFLKKYDDAAETYKAALKISPDDAALKEGLKKAMDAKYDVPSASSRNAGGPSMKLDMEKLKEVAKTNPKIAAHLENKELMQKLNMIMQLGGGQQVPQELLMQIVQQDPRFLELIMAMNGMEMPAQSAASPPPEPKKPKKDEPKKEEPPPEDLRSPETKAADEWKLKGNELYKKKQFAEAIEMYDKAIEAQPNDLIYPNNKCAVWIEMGKYDEVIACCKDLIERRYEINSSNPGGASFEKVAKVLNRMASVHEKQHNYEAAIELYNKALTEDNNKQTRNALREAERLKEKKEKEAYINPEKAEEHNEKAKAHFQAKEWAAAKAEYDEAIKRNPKDPKLYSNRSAAYTKLMAYPQALQDLDECLKIDPKFVKAYSRKGAAHFFMKEYNKALKAYGDGLAIDPSNEECKKGQEQVMAKISEMSHSKEVDEEQVRHAMADPEIQQILHDPQINMFLQELQKNPAEASKALHKDPKLKEAIDKLIAAGIVRLG